MMGHVHTDDQCETCLSCKKGYQIARRRDGWGNTNINQKYKFCNIKNRYVQIIITDCGDYHNTTLEALLW